MKSFYSVKGLPCFQNKVYSEKNIALEAETGDVNLIVENGSGLIINQSFDQKKMIYDQNYQNEQGHSKFFKNHLEKVIEILLSYNLENKKVIEIGCGKGLFLEMLREKNIDVIGFDPTYEGNQPYIEKKIFDDSINLTGDFIILRHTMEHIPNPFSFIKKIAKANSFNGKIYIEVPTFQWIVDNNAFWDIFYEHCNYFTEQSFSSFFHTSKTGRLFNGQYMYIIADLDQLKNSPHALSVENFEEFNLVLKNELNYWKKFVKKNERIVVWGAGAKGSTFVNLVDKKNEYIEYIVDVNPSKQNKYVGCSGHSIKSQEYLKKNLPDSIIVMNPNYLQEIKSLVGNEKIKYFTL